MSPNAAGAGNANSWKRTVPGLAFVVVGVLGRASIHKLIALRGSPETVAMWAQLHSVIELIGGVVLAGIGTGLSVLVSGSDTTEERIGLLNSALWLGLGLALPFALALALLGVFLSSWAGGERMAPAVVAMAAAVGWFCVIPGIPNAFWLAEQRRWPMFLPAACTSLLVVIAGLPAPVEHMLQSMLLAMLAPALALGAWLMGTRKPLHLIVRDRAHDRALLHYLLPGLSIGIMSPLSWLFIRGFAAPAVSWQDVVRMQALSRVSEWVTALAAAAVCLFFLPASAGRSRTGGLCTSFGAPRFGC